MSIDGIGKPGGPAPGAPASPAAPASPSPASFAVGGATAAPAAASSGSDAFSALERGELTVEQYLEARVESAVAPLVAKLSPEQLEFVRGELRGALETDPVLVELVRKSTGRASNAG
jgi:hypothetical protein